MHKLLLLTLFIPTLAFANFTLISVGSIECRDLEKTLDVEVYFTTGSVAAHKYTRRPDTIPYDYGNLRTQDFGSGQMTLSNNPDAEGGVISLIDAYDSNHLVTLVLTPSATMTLDSYDGVLSGQVQTRNGLEALKERKMSCTILRFRIR